MKSLRAGLYIYIASLMALPAHAVTTAPSTVSVRQLLTSSLNLLGGIGGLKDSAQSGIMLADLRVQKLPELWRMAGSVNHPSSTTLADNTMAKVSCALTYSELQKLRAAAAAGKPDVNALETTEKYYQRYCVDTAIATAGTDLFTGDLINTATKEWLALHMGGDLAVGRKNAEIMLASGAGFDGGSSGWGDFLNSLHGGSSSLSDADDASGQSFTRLYDRLAAGNYIDESKITAQGESLSPGSLVGGFKAGSIVPNGYSSSEGFAAATNPAQSIWNDFPGSSALSLSLGGGAGSTKTADHSAASGRVETDLHGRGIAAVTQPLLPHKITPVDTKVTPPATNEANVKPPIVPNDIPKVSQPPVAQLKTDGLSLGDAFSDGAGKKDHEYTKPAVSGTPPSRDDLGSYARALTGVIKNEGSDANFIRQDPDLSSAARVGTSPATGHAPNIQPAGTGDDGSVASLGLAAIVASDRASLAKESKSKITVDGYMTCAGSTATAGKKDVLIEFFKTVSQCGKTLQVLQGLPDRGRNECKLSTFDVPAVRMLNLTSRGAARESKFNEQRYFQLECMAADIAAMQFACSTDATRPIESFLVEAKVKLAAANHFRGDALYNGSTTDIAAMYAVAACGLQPANATGCPREEVGNFKNDATWALLISAMKQFTLSKNEVEVARWVHVAYNAGNLVGCDFNAPLRAVSDYLVGNKLDSQIVEKIQAHDLARPKNVQEKSRNAGLAQTLKDATEQVCKAGVCAGSTVLGHESPMQP